MCWHRSCWALARHCCSPGGRTPFLAAGHWRDGCWFFQMVNHYDPSGNELVDFAEQDWFFDPRHRFNPYEMPPYTLVFYDALGYPAGTVTGGTR